MTSPFDISPEFQAFLSHSILWFRPSTCPPISGVPVLCHKPLWQPGEAHASDKNIGLQGIHYTEIQLSNYLKNYDIIIYVLLY